MITLAPNDSLGGVLQVASTMIATVFGEQVPVGGGPPTPYYLATTVTSTGWQTIANAPTGYQLLINQIVVINQSGAANGFASAIFPQTPGSWVAGGLNIGGGASGWLTIPAYGMAIYSRSGWRVLTQYGNDQQVAQLGCRASAPTQTLGAGGNLINSWSSLSQGTLATASASGITLQREGSWFLSGTFRLLPNIEHYMTFTVNGTMFFNDYPVGTPPGAASGAGISWSTIWACAAGDLVSLNLFCASAPSSAAQGTTQVFAHWICPYR